MIFTTNTKSRFVSVVFESVREALGLARHNDGVLVSLVLKFILHK